MVKALAAIAVLAGIASLAVVACGGGDAEEEAPAPPPAAAPEEPGKVTGSSGPAAEPTRTGGVTGQTGGAIDFTVYANEEFKQRVGAFGGAPHIKIFSFSPSEMTFKVGETVNFTFIPPTTTINKHTFTVEALGINETAAYGKVATFTYTFDKPGRFRLTSRNFANEGMMGWITVE